MLGSLRPHLKWKYTFVSLSMQKAWMQSQCSNLTLGCSVKKLYCLFPYCISYVVFTISFICQKNLLGLNFRDLRVSYWLFFFGLGLHFIDLSVSYWLLFFSFFFLGQTCFVNHYIEFDPLKLIAETSRIKSNFNINNSCLLQNFMVWGWFIIQVKI